MDERGQIQISFGMIFSIIIIIVTIAVAVYVIQKFVAHEGSISCKLFERELQNAIDKAWAEDLTSKIFNGKVPESLEKVCFGNSSQQFSGEDEKAFEEFKLYSTDSNMLFYPINKGCKDSFTYTLEHAETEKFFCAHVKNGEINVKLTKNRFDRLVKLSEN